MPDVAFRPMASSDLSFITANWLNHYKNHSYFAKRIRNSVYFDWHKHIVLRILGKAESTILMAHAAGEPDVLLGFSASEQANEGQVVHFVFVKKEFRRLGIARKLLEESRVEPGKAYFTHWTYDLDPILEKLEGITYDPYRL